MKGGAIFNPKMSEATIRMIAHMGDIEQTKYQKAEVYRSPRRLLLIQEITKYNYQDPDSPMVPSWKNPSPQVGNLHAVLITLPETDGAATYELVPRRNNFFDVNMAQIFRAITNALHHGQPNYPGYGVLVLKNEESSKVRRRQIESLKAVGEKGKLPEVIEQKIAAMAGLTATPKAQRPLTTTIKTATEAVPLAEVQSAMLPAASEEAKADAIIDAAFAWVKAWNVEHFAEEGKRKQATDERKKAEAALNALKSGSPPSSSSSSSSSAAPQGGRRKKTRRSLRKKRTTRRR